jgi:hypothetical protein
MRAPVSTDSVSTVYRGPKKLKIKEINCSYSINVFALDTGLLTSSQHSEGPATGHLDTGVTRFPRV